MIKKKISLLVALLCLSTIIYGRGGAGKANEVEMVKNSTVLVVLSEENPKLVKKLSKKKGDQLAKYRQGIVDYNNAFTNAFTRGEIFARDVKFITPSELKKYDVKSNRGKYSIFETSFESGNANQKSMLKSKQGRSTSTLSFVLRMPGRSNKIVFSMISGTYKINEADVTHAIAQCSEFLEKTIKRKVDKVKSKALLEAVNKRATVLKDRKLLIDENNLNKDVLRNIKSYYPYDYAITTKEEIDKAIINKDVTVAFLRMMPIHQIKGGGGSVTLSKMMFAQGIYDAQDCTTLYYSKQNTLLGGSVSSMLANSKWRLRKKDLLKIVEQIDSK